MAGAVRYEFRLAELLSPEAREVFPELVRGKTLGGDLLYGPVCNQDHLHSLLSRLQTVHVTVVEVRRLPD